MPTSKNMQFTPKAIDKFPIPASGRRTVYDADTPQLGLRVDANGRKSFFWFKTANGVAIFRALGEWPVVEIAQARIEARKWQNKLEEWRKKNYAGDDPFEKKTDAEVTLADLRDKYIDKHVKKFATHPDRAEREVRWMIDKYLADWTGKRLSAITAKLVRDRHDEISEKHGKVMADRVVQLVRRLFAWGMDSKRQLHSGANPAQGTVDFNGYTKRERFLSGEELQRLFAAMKKIGNQDLVDFIVLSLWTGARRSDVLGMRWQDIADGVWRVPLPKGGVPYSLPLVPEVLEVLERRQRLAAARVDAKKKTQQNLRPLADAVAEYVFPSTGKTGHLVEMKRGWERLLTRAKIENLHIHDLRRTLASWQAGLGTSLPLIGRTLGHAAGSSATSIYARLDLEPVRQSIAGAVGAMVMASKKKPKKVRKPAKPKPERPLLTAGKGTAVGAAQAANS